MLALLASSHGALGAGPQRVLIVQSYGRGYEPFETQASAFRAELTADRKAPIEFLDLSLDPAMFSGGTSEAPLTAYLSSVGADRRIDLIVAVGGPAARFLQRHRARLFPDAPLLIAGVDVRHITPEVLTDRDSAVSVRFDLAAVFANVFTLLPDTREIDVVIGTSPLERFWRGELEREFAEFAPRAKLVFLHEVPYEAILERAARSSTGTVFLAGMYAIDAAGIPHTEDAATRELTSVAAVPVFGVLGPQFGKGIVGGPLVPTREVGIASAQVAAKILAGDTSPHRPQPIPPTAPMYDARELDRFHIPADRLPSGAVVRFRAPSFWEANRRTIMGSAVIVGLETTLIVVLISNLRRRRKAEEGLRDVSRRLIAAQEDERARLARELHDDVTQRLARVAIDVGRLDSEPMRTIHGELTRLSEDVHSLAYRLHPSILDDLGLAEAIRVECEGFGTRCQIAARFEAREVPEAVPAGTAIVLFRIAQEALRNIERHAQASSVEVTLQGSDGGLQLVIRDDGVGFERKRTAAKRSLGQASMQERIRLVQGEIDIDSAPGEGTTILAWVPLGPRSA